MADESENEESKKSGGGKSPLLLIVVAAVVSLLVGGGGSYFFLKAEKGKYKWIFAKYFTSLLKGNSFEKAYEDAFGKIKMDKLHEVWKAYMGKLK